jgi:ParB family transcriptional regulator, chromosome partitioning protein
MPADLPHSQLRRTTLLAPSQLKASSFSFSIYGDPNIESDDLLLSVREFGILVPLVVAPEPAQGSWEVISGHRRLACALALGLPKVPCVIRSLPSGLARWKVVLEYNRQRRKTFSQLMREADALEDIWGTAACSRKLANLKKGRNRQRNARGLPDRRDSDDRAGTRHWQPIAEAGPTTQVKFGRTDSTIARQLGMGGKDTYRQARAIWKLAQSGDSRAQSGVAQLDVGSKTIHAAYKDLRRRDRFGANFRPTPYDVWLFRHDQAFGIPYPGAIPPGIVAHALYYYTKPGNLVVDPMAGGGTTLDVCRSMNRRCLAYDIAPSRPDIFLNDIRQGFPLESAGCDLIFCDPPYHTMLAGRYCQKGIASSPLDGWLAFLLELAHSALATLRPGGYLALLLASQTEKDLPRGFGYLDHAFFGYLATIRAGFLPIRRISCPLNGAYLPQQVCRARNDGRLLGQVRDLLMMRKAIQVTDPAGPLPANVAGIANRQQMKGHEGVSETEIGKDTTF